MKVTSPNQLASMIKEYRLDAKLTQSDVAKEIGIRQDTVSSFELKPETTKIATLFKILAALNLEVDIKPRSTDTSSFDGWNEKW